MAGFLKMVCVWTPNKLKGTLWAVSGLLDHPALLEKQISVVSSLRTFLPKWLGSPDILEGLWKGSGFPLKPGVDRISGGAFKAIPFHWHWKGLSYKDSNYTGSLESKGHSGTYSWKNRNYRHLQSTTVAAQTQPLCKQIFHCWGSHDGLCLHHYITELNPTHSQNTHGLM